MTINSTLTAATQVPSCQARLSWAGATPLLCPAPSFPPLQTQGFRGGGGGEGVILTVWLPLRLLEAMFRELRSAPVPDLGAKSLKCPRSPTAGAMGALPMTPHPHHL